MLYFENRSLDPYFNQAFEEYIFENYPDDEILLLWRNGPAVVCGSYQNVFAEVNVPKAMDAGVAIVRRPSGGGTVYHDEGNLNYTYIRSCKAEEVTYGPFIEPMVKALNAIGIPAEMNRTCDIAIDGLKVSGSAQKIVKDRVLHHGTLLYRCDLKALKAIANGQRDSFESKGTKSVPWPVTNMADHIAGKPMEMEDFMAGLKAEFEKMFSVEERRLSEEELEKIRTAAREKYQNWDWTYGKSPAFTCKRRFEFNGEEIALSYSAKRGVIEEIEFTPAKKTWSDALRGKRLCAEELQELFTGEEKELYRYIF